MTECLSNTHEDWALSRIRAKRYRQKKVEKITVTQNQEGSLVESHRIQAAGKTKTSTGGRAMQALRTHKTKSVIYQV